MQITRAMKREAALREVGMRRRVYPRWVREGRMTDADAHREIAIMEAIAADYTDPDLFAAKVAA
jgi:hypothetical protein